eukprot:m51a1_g5577 hypothetical protein (979) ;mRNA; f:619941-624111
MSSTRSTPTLVPPGGAAPLTPTSADISVRVFGFIVETTWTLTFHNTSSTTIGECGFHFPTLEQEHIVSYGNDATETGNLAEAHVTWGIGPHEFSAKVSLPASGNRRVLVRTDLYLHQPRLSINFPFPALESMSLAIAVWGSPTCPSFAEPVPWIPKLEFMALASSATAFVASSGEVTAEEIALWPDVPELAVDLPALSLSDGQNILVADDRIDGGQVFVCTDYPMLPYDAETSISRLSTTIALVLDCSLSSRHCNREAECALVRALCFSLRVQLVSTVDVYIVREKTEMVRTLQIRDDSSIDELCKIMANEPCDGGSRHGSLVFPADQKYRFCLVFTDGVRTIGKDVPAFGTTAYVFSSSKRSKTEDTPMLFIGSEENQAISDFFPNHSEPIISGPPRHFVMTGKLHGPQGTIKAHYGKGSFVVRTVDISVAPEASLGDCPPVLRYWVRQKLAEMTVKGEPPENIVALSRRYGTVGWRTGLLFMDRLDQYTHNDVSPDSNAFPSLSAAYTRYAETRRREEKSRVGSKLEKLSSKWSEYRKWREGTFISPVEFEIRSERERRAQARREKSLSQTINSAFEVPSFSGIIEEEEEGSMILKPSTSFRSWDSSTPYMEALTSSAKQGAKGAYSAYLHAREQYVTSPSFYIDVSNFFSRTMHQKDLAVRTLTSVFDLEVEDPQLYRILAVKSHRDLGLLYDKMGRTQEAIDLLWAVICGKWRRSFEGIELTALTELNRILHKAATNKAKLRMPDGLDDRFIAPVDIDIRIVMSWDTPRTEVELTVVEPTAEKCCTLTPLTKIGGFLSKASSTGFGPEEYMCRTAANGKYVVQAKYNCSIRHDLSGGTTLLVNFWTNYSRPEETCRTATIRINKNTDLVTVSEFLFFKEAPAEVRQMLEQVKKEEDEEDKRALEEARRKVTKAQECSRTDLDQHLKDIGALRQQLSQLRVKGPQKTKSKGGSAGPAKGPGAKGPGQKSAVCSIL